MSEQPNYYGILPASVRYDKSVPPAARLLYSELTALCNKHGYCFAGNEYFAELYDVSPETVSRWISKLARARHIVVTIDQAANEKRRIYMVEEAYKLGLIGQPLDEKIKRPLDKNVNNLLTKTSTPLDKKIKHNINNNNKNLIDEESAFHAQLNTENTFEQTGASPAAPARKTPTKAQPKAQTETQPNTDQNTDQNAPQNTSPAARLRTAITESMSWIQENTDIVRDWFMLSKQTPPANNADIPAHLQDQVVSFFSYYQQQGNERAIKKPVDFLQTSFIRWMQSNRERVAIQAAQADRMDKGQTGNAGQNKAASAQQTDAAPLAHIPWV